MLKRLKFRPEDDITNTRRGTKFYRGFAPFPVTDIQLSTETWGFSYNQPFPFIANYPVIYLNGAFDWVGYYTAAGLSYPVHGSKVDEFNAEHEFRVYLNGERMLILGDSGQISENIYQTTPYFQDIPVIPGQTYKIRISVYNTVKDQEDRSGLFTYNCPALEKPANVRIENISGDIYLQWDYPTTYPALGCTSDNGPATWKVTANGVELNRSAAGAAGGEGPGAPVQLLSGDLAAGTHNLVVTPVFEDVDGNVYEYESTSLNTEILPASANFTAVVTGQDVAFTWDAVDGEPDGYNVYVSSGGSPVKQNESLIGGLAFNLNGEDGGSYSAYVVPVKNGVEGLKSNVENYEIAVSADAYTDFSEYTSDQTPSDWTLRWDTSTNGYQVKDDAAATGGKVLRYLGDSGGGRRALSWDALDSLDGRDNLLIEIRFRGTVDNGSINHSDPRVMARASGSVGNETGYIGGLRMSETLNQGFRIGRYISGSFTLFDNTLSVPFQDNVWYRQKVRLVNNEYYLKIWLDEDPEPAGWILNGTDPSPILVEGWVGFAKNGSGVYDIDWFKITLL